MCCTLGKCKIRCCRAATKTSTPGTEETQTSADISRLSGASHHAPIIFLEHTGIPRAAFRAARHVGRESKTARQLVLSKTRAGIHVIPGKSSLPSPNCTKVRDGTRVKIFADRMRDTAYAKTDAHFFDRQILYEATVTSFTPRPAEYPEPSRMAQRS